MKTDTKNYTAVTAAYWAFTLTDGALRMLVLLHFHTLGYSPLDLAFLFLFYEAMGIVTNLVGGWLGTRYGLRLTLYTGLAIQIIALLVLSETQPHWSLMFSVVYVMMAQALSGIAKDLVKMSSKSAVKLVTADREDHGLLFRWVAMLTGSKNTLKGIGFLIGGILLQGLGFQVSLWSMAVMLAMTLLMVTMMVRSELGQLKSVISRKDVFSKTREINLLSAARVFLFASRDVWFVVGVPVFLHSQLGYSFQQTGSFMATWVICYGLIQAGAPKFLRNIRTTSSGARAAQHWIMLLAVLTALLAVAISTEWEVLDARIILIGGLFLFGAVFAVNSSVHSFLIVAYSDKDKIALNVGFYYMANAIGRLLGTLLSGLVYQLAGLTACLATSAFMLAVAALLSLKLPAQNQRPPEAVTKH